MIDKLLVPYWELFIKILFTLMLIGLVAFPIFALGSNALGCQLTPDNLAATVKALDLLGFESGQILLACRKIGQLATSATHDTSRADLLAAAVCRRVLNLVRP